MTTGKSIPSVSVTYAQNGRSTRSNELGMRPRRTWRWGTAEHWVRMQASYELAQARRDRADAERRTRTLHA